MQLWLSTNCHDVDNTQLLSCATHVLNCSEALQWVILWFSIQFSFHHEFDTVWLFRFESKESKKSGLTHRYSLVQRELYLPFKQNLFESTVYFFFFIFLVWPCNMFASFTLEKLMSYQWPISYYNTDLFPDPGLTEPLSSFQKPCPDLVWLNYVKQLLSGCKEETIMFRAKDFAWLKFMQ